MSLRPSVHPPPVGGWPAGRCMNQKQEFRERSVRCMKYTNLDGEVIECTVAEYKEIKAADKPADNGQRYVALSQELLDVFDVIREYGPISRTDLAVVLNSEAQTVSNQLQRLKVKGLVQGTDGHSTWELTEPAAGHRLLPRVIT